MLKTGAINHRTDMTEQRRHAVQTQLGSHERAFGEVAPRKDPAPDPQPGSSPNLNMGKNQQQHPLLKDSQQFSGMEPSQASSVADNLDAAEALLDNAQQLAEKYHMAGNNCVESVIKACNDSMDLKLSDDAIRMASGMGLW